MKTGIIHSVGVGYMYINEGGGGDSRGQGEGTKVKATKTSRGGGLNASPSYNPPRDCNISSYDLLLPAQQLGERAQQL